MEELESQGSEYLSKCGTNSSIYLRGQWKNWEASFRKQALGLGVTVTEIDRKPLEAALTGLYTKVLTDSHSSIWSSRSKETNKVFIGSGCWVAVPPALLARADEVIE